jgi:hypothetical protein
MVAVPPEIIQTFDNFLTIMTGLGGALLAWLFGMAGFHYMTSGGDPMKVRQAKDYGQNAVVGFIVIVLARIIANLIRSAVGA